MPGAAFGDEVICDRKVESIALALVSLTCFTSRQAQIPIPIWQKPPWPGQRWYSSRLTNRIACYLGPSWRRGDRDTPTRVTPRDNTTPRTSSMPSPKTIKASQPGCVNSGSAWQMHRTAPHRIRSLQANSVQRDFSTAPFLVSNRIESYPPLPLPV